MRDLRFGGLLGCLGFDQRGARALVLGGGDEKLRIAPFQFGLGAGGALLQVRGAVHFDFGEIALGRADRDVGLGPADGGDRPLHRGLGSSQLRTQFCRIQPDDDGAFLDEVPLVDADFRHPAWQFCRNLDAGDLDAAIGRGKTIRRPRRHAVLPVEVTARAKHQSNGNGQYRRTSHHPFPAKPSIDRSTDRHVAPATIGALSQVNPSIFAMDPPTSHGSAAWRSSGHRMAIG